jgi:hypothetical protein
MPTKKKKRYTKKFSIPPLPPSWARRVHQLQARLARDQGTGIAYLVANCDAVYRTVDGRGSDSAAVHPAAGARITYNMPSVHVPGFCAATAAGHAYAYKNCYDIADETASSSNKFQVNERRKLVDNALPLPKGGSVPTIYFGAVDVNGTGVRFYGDVCLVLKRDEAVACVILDRNSYDLVRSPVKELVAQVDVTAQHAARQTIARSWSGSWHSDLQYMVASKALTTLPPGARRWTAGHISYAVCSDEDYIEVLKQGSFNAHDLQEARLAAFDIAEDALTAARVASRSPAPRLESMLWAWRRARAEEALRSAQVMVRIVGHHGRTKG